MTGDAVTGDDVTGKDRGQWHPGTRLPRLGQPKSAAEVPSSPGHAERVSAAVKSASLPKLSHYFMHLAAAHGLDEK